jgi:acetoacetate decarboxylase
MKRNAWLIAMACLCVILSVSLLLSIAQNKKTKSAREKFVPSPEFSPAYPPLPHHFNNLRGIEILCQAPKGAIKRAIAKPLEQKGDDDRFVLLMGWTPECEGYNVHEIAINALVKWKDKTGNTTLIEYIDSGMGLIAGREIWGWPKKMADITWTQTTTGWKITCNTLKDLGSRKLMEIEYTISNSTPKVDWPVMGPTLLVKRIPNASAAVAPLTQLVCVGCNVPPGGAPAFEPPPGSKSTKGTAKVQFFDAPQNPLAFLGPVKVLDAKMNIMEGPMKGGLGLGDVIYQWEEQP